MLFLNIFGLWFIVLGKKGILNIFGKKKAVSDVEEEIENKEDKTIEKDSEEKKESPRKKKEIKIKSAEDKEKGEEKVKGKSGKRPNPRKPGEL